MIINMIVEGMSEDDLSEYEDDWEDDDNSIWQDMDNETVHIDERKASTNSTSSEVSVEYRTV